MDGTAGQVAPGETISITADGPYTLAYRAVDFAGRTGITQTLTLSIDQTAPTVSCGAPDGLWHADNVSIACSASDSGSGLQDTADAAFSLTTTVAAGTETSAAATGSRQVCDQAGNCATAGPIGGNRVDRKGPDITIDAPTGNYLLSEAVAASYSCTDGGSGVAMCAGPVASGGQIDTATPGNKGFGVQATDNVGNGANASATYDVTYRVCILYDQTRSYRSGSTVPLRLQLCDAGAANFSAESIVVHGAGLRKLDNSASAVLADAGNANPDNDFRYDAALGGYVYNLSTRGLTTGTWALSFTVSGDPLAHTLTFDLR